MSKGSVIDHGYLPLKWWRVLLFVWTFGFGIVLIIVGAQSISGADKLEETLKAQFERGGSVLRLNCEDIRSLTNFLVAADALLITTVFTCMAMLLWDWGFPKYSRSTPGAINEGKLAKTHIPLSTRTLKWQSIILSFLMCWLFIILITTTLVARTHEFTLTVTEIGPESTTIGPFKYWDYGFWRRLGVAPWFTFIVGFPATISTICACFAYQSHNAAVANRTVDEKMGEKDTSSA